MTDRNAIEKPRGAGLSVGPAVTVLCQVFHPDAQSTSQLLSDVFAALAQGGHGVTVVSGYPGMHDGQPLPATEIWQDVTIPRGGSRASVKKNLWLRSWTYLSYSFHVAWHLIRRRGRWHVLVVTNPSFLPVIAWLVCRLRGHPFKVMLHDVYPDGLVAMGRVGQGGLVDRLWSAANRRTFRAASAVWVLGRDMAQHTSLMPKGSQVRELFETALNCYDQPSYDGINSYFISMLVRQAGIKVALSGLGGDELFVGYEGFRKVQRVNQIGRAANLLPGSVRSWLSESVSATSTPGDAIWGTLSDVLDPELADFYFSSRTVFSRRCVERLTQSRLKSEWSEQRWIRREHELTSAAASLQDLDRASFLEIQTYMLSTLLRDADQMSMAHGLELRVPLIDAKLLEHVLPVTIKDKIVGGVGKQILLAALGDLLPADVVNRRKRGFTLPFREWMQRDLQHIVGQRLLEIKPLGPWDRKTFRQFWFNFQEGRITWARAFSIFVLEHWLQQNGVSV